MNPTESRLFLGWLASPFDANLTNPELSGAAANYVPNRTYFGGYASNYNRRVAIMGKDTDGKDTEGKKLLDDLANPIEAAPDGVLVPLVSYGTVSLPTGLSSFQRNYMGAVDARPQPLPGPAFSDGKTLGANGRYAFWIGDEGVKAKVNLPDAYASTGGGAFLSSEDWDKGFAGSATQRNSFGTIGTSGSTIKEGVNPKGTLPAGFNFETWRSKDIGDHAGNPQTYQLAKAVGISGLSAWAANQGGLAAGQAMNDAAKLLWHDITTVSYSTLTDTYNGGVKIDLSAAFEIPYAMFRGVEMYPGQKDSAITSDSKLRKQSLFHGAPNISTNAAGMALDLDYNRPNLVDKLGSANDLLLASPKSPEWAPRNLRGLAAPSYSALVTRNANETPERLGFVYEAPLRSSLFNQDRLVATTEMGPNAAGTNTTRYNALPWPELSAVGTENLLSRISRGPTWDLYRNYYRMYKREVEAAATVSGQALRGFSPAADAVAARGIEPLTYATGNLNPPMQRGRDTKNNPAYVAVTPPEGHYANGNANTGKYFYRNNLSAPSDAPSFQGYQGLRYPNLLVNRYSAGIMNFDRLGLAKPNTTTSDGSFDTPPTLTTRTWPTSMSLTPSIVRFSMVFSGVFDTAIAGDPNGTIGVSVDPLIVVHNPYDTPIEFEGIAMVCNGDSLPYIFNVSVSSWSYSSTMWQYYDPTRGGPRSANCEPKPKVDPLWTGAQVSSPISLGEIALGDGAADNRSFSFRAVAGSGGKFRLEPGEVRVLSPKNLGGVYKSNRANNVAIVTDSFGYDLGNTAVYKMTPFANVRYRQTGDVSTQWREGSPGPDARLWTWGFMPNNPSTNLPYLGTNPPAIGYFGDYASNLSTNLHDILGVWYDILNARKLHDAFPTWDGTAKKLALILATPPPGNEINRPLTFTVKNSSWFGYDNCVVGEEGVKGSANYVYPRKRNGTTSIGGHQTWNFYLIGQKSIDGRQALSASRRWFGAPDYSNQNDANFKYEGTETAGGFHMVDEPLLLSFHALTSGWPMYGNDNGHYSNIVQPNENWKLYLPSPGTVRPPDYRIAARGLVAGKPDSYSAGGTTGDPYIYGPLQDPEFAAPEVTGGKAGTLNSRIQGFVSPLGGSLKQQFFMADFLLRSADMTTNTLNKWYPENKATPNSLPFKFQTVKNSDGVTDLTWEGQTVDTLRTPKEMLNAPMTPYFISIRPQQAHLYGYDGKAHTPLGWVLSQRQLISPDGDNKNLTVDTALQHAYWGASVDPTTDVRSDAVIFPIPRRPLLSLAQLGSAGFAQVNTDADFTVGSSFANPGINDLTKVTAWPGPMDTEKEDIPTPEHGYVGKHEGTRMIRNYANVRTDHAFAANLALWDSYYFSGLNLQANSYTLPGAKSAFPGGPDLPVDTAIANAQKSALQKATGNTSLDASSFADLKTALEAGTNPLANKRMTFFPDGTAAAANGKFPEPTQFPHPTYLARNSLYEGGFNVNSTSKSAWKAVLAGMKGQTLPDGASTTGTVLTKFARSFKTGNGNTPWNNYRELTDAEIDDLAGEVVKEVRNRGPFMSLSDFINRRLLADTHGLKGALQAAIDNSRINDLAIPAAAAGGPNALSGGTFAHPYTAHFEKKEEDKDYNKRPDTKNFKDTGGVYSFLATGPSYARQSPRFPRLASMSRTGTYKNQTGADPLPIVNNAVAGLGAPQIISQMDILNSVGPHLTVRSDTFTVRAYGEALDNAGNTIGRAWVEVVVQRTPYLIAPSAKGLAYDEPTRRKLAYRINGSSTLDYDYLPVVDPFESVNANGTLGGLPAGFVQADKEGWIINRLLGRRFKTTAIRWLNANEI